MTALPPSTSTSIAALLPYLPADRRAALALGHPLPDHSSGAALFADISGFTPLTEALTRELGPLRGAEELPHYLDSVYGALIAEVDRFGGSVIGFSGDALTCWFPEPLQMTDCRLQQAEQSTIDNRQSAINAVACALAMQYAIGQFAAIALPSGTTATLAMKAAVAAGPVRRFQVGDPQLQYLDILAGATVDRMAAAEQQANKGEVVVSAEVAKLLAPDLQISAWRSDSEGRRFAVVAGLALTPPTLDLNAMPDLQSAIYNLQSETLRPWLLPAVYERIETGQDAFLAELRPAIALFLRFGGLDYDHAAAGERLDQYLRWVQHRVARYEGTLVQVTIGDKGSYLYVAFGAPVAHEDDAARAVALALALRTPPAELNWVSDVQIGISRGSMRVGAYGGPTRRTYGVLGDDVNLAARLMSTAQPGQILVSSRIVYATARDYDFDELGQISVKGKQAPLAVFALHGLRAPMLAAHGARATSAESKAYNATTAPAMVGRTTERALLASQLAALRQAGHQGVLLIEGEPGIGKSRLVADLRRQAQSVACTTFVGAGSAIEQSTLYFAWREVFAQLLDLNVLTEPAARRRHLLDLLEDEPELLLLAPLLNTVMLLEMPDNEVTAQLTGQVRAEHTRDLLVQFLRASTQRSAKVLVLEDAHWLDSASWALLLEVVAKVPRLLTVVSARPFGAVPPPEYHRLCNLPAARVLRLDALPLDDTLALVCARLGVRSMPAPVVELIRDKAQGNPFFSEELAYTLRDSGLLQIEAGECRLAPGVDDLRAIAFPDTVQGVITSRIDRLSPQQQLTLKVASVIGRVFAFRTLRDIYPVQPDRPRLAEYLSVLEQLDHTPVESPEPELAYIFKHVITQEVAYNLMLFSQRRDLHRTVAEWFERSYADDLAPFYALLAHHWRHAEQPARAIDYLERASQQALRDGAYQEAVRFFSEALALDQAQPPTRPGTSVPGGSISTATLRRATWERQLGEAYYGLGKLAVARQHLEQALHLLGQPLPTTRRGLIGAMLRQVLTNDQRSMTNVDGRRWTVDERLQSSVFRLPSSVFRLPSSVFRLPSSVFRLLPAALTEAVRSYERLAQIAYLDQRRLQTIYTALCSLRMAQQGSDPTAIARGYANLSLAAAIIPWRTLASSYQRRALAAIETTDDLATRSYTQQLIGIANAGMGALPIAADMLGRAVFLATQLGDQRRWAESVAALAYVLGLRGDLLGCLAFYGDLVDTGRQRGDSQQHIWGLNGKAWALLWLGDHDQATDLLEAAGQLLGGQADHSAALSQTGLLALARLRQGDTGAARQAANAGLMLARQAVPTVFTTLEGYSAIAETYLGLWAQAIAACRAADVRQLRRQAQQALSHLRRYCRIFPLGLARYWLLEGRFANLAGNQLAAHTHWQRAQYMAARLTLPYELALARLAG